MSLVKAVLGLPEAKLSPATRNSIPSSKFAEPKSRKYPIEDRAHAVNALSRVGGNGSPAEKAAVRRKVCSKYPGLPSCKEAVDAILSS